MENLEIHATKKQKKEAALKHHRIGSFVDGKITREELAKLLSCSLNHTYTLVRRYDYTDKYQYLNKKIGKTINQKATPEVKEKLINGF
jgi:Mor family transcriptional regulator